MLSWSDGDWVEDYGWTRWGLTPTSTPAVEGQDTGPVSHGDGDAELQYAPATAMGDAVASASPSSPSSAVPSASSSASTTKTVTHTSAPTLPFHSRYSAKIPPGWTPQARETDYYAVPIIIAMSVLVAVIVVASIVMSVFVRRRRKRRREKRRERRRARQEGGAEGGEGGEEVAQEEKDTREKGWRGVVGRVEDGLRRRNKGQKKAPQGGVQGEGGEEASPAPARRRIVRTTGFAAGDRIRRRRRRRRAGGGHDDEDDEGTALTRTGTSSTTSSVVNNTLTARVAARLRRQDSTGSAASRTGGAGTSTVFSRDINAQSAVSLTASALTRVSSRASGSSRRLPASAASSAAAEQPTILFTPADDATLPAHLPLPGSPAPGSLSLTLTPTTSLSRPLQPQPPIPSSATPTDAGNSAFYSSLIISDDSLPAPGPPAYRPAGSTVQATRRFGAGDAGDAGRRRGVSERRGQRGRGADVREEDEGEWYWPGEKGRSPLADSSTSAAASAPPVVPADDPPASPANEDSPVDRSLFTAHVATDDKAVLARLRAQRDVVLEDEDACAVAGSSSSLPDPSAPAPEEDEEDPEVDADGFERYDLAEVDASPFDAEPAPIASSSSTLLPPPPQKVHQPSLAARSSSAVPLFSSASTASTSSSSPFSSSSTEKARLAASYAAAEEEGEDDALPIYLAGSGQSGAREALALANAPPGSDVDDDEDEAGWAKEVVRNEGQREEEGIV
ncbi:hypothetical protein JCM10295v2_003207 [Rhodotorula toruloides]